MNLVYYKEGQPDGKRELLNGVGMGAASERSGQRLDNCLTTHRHTRRKARRSLERSAGVTCRQVVFGHLCGKKSDVLVVHVPFLCCLEEQRTEIRLLMCYHCGN
jgi:hypothetical protein